jgi:hypothetical protein
MLPYAQPFNTAAGTTAAFTTSYPEFAQSLLGGSATVDGGGQLHITAGSGQQSLTVTPTLSIPGATELITADVGGTFNDPDGNFRVGLQVGTDYLFWHVGFGGDAFRVERISDAFRIINNTDMTGFQNVGGTLNNLFATSYTATAGTYGGAVGFYRNGPASNINGTLEMLGDNLTIQQVVPEPSVMLLLGVGGLLIWRRRK